MSSEDETAFRSADPAVIAAYETWLQDWKINQQRRLALAAEVGRKMWVSGGGWDGSTHAVGFVRTSDDKEGDLFLGGLLIVSSKRGRYSGMIVPNRKTKAGRAFWEKEMRELDSPAIKLPGMPQFYLGGLSVYRPAIWPCEDKVYVLWGTDPRGKQAGDDMIHADDRVGEQWEQIPLSVYHLAKEQCDREHEASDA